jgi:signal transduction histidine kinase
VDAGLKARGDVRMIESILRNLLGNAWKYTANTATPGIHVYTEDRDGEPRFCVADNGAGFDRAYAGKLFQPFQRLHRQDEFPGIGIGIGIGLATVQRHGGIIQAHGEPGKGAIFCFTLPGMPANKDP